MSMISNAFSSFSGVFAGASTSSTASAPDPMCLNCRVNLKFKTQGGRTFDHCSRTCASRANTTAFPNCRRCQVRPRYRANNSNKIYQHCGRKCASLDMSHEKSLVLRSPNCRRCKVRPKFTDGERIFSHCSRTCSRLDPEQNLGGNAGSRSRTTLASNRTPLSDVGNTSTLVDTELDNTSDADDTATLVGDYRTRMGLTNECLYCMVNPKNQGHFCSKECSDQAHRATPKLLEVPIGHVTFHNITQQFRKSWKHQMRRCPQVSKVYKIISSNRALINYDNYRNAVEANGKYEEAAMSKGNEQRRWHGTTRECTLGDHGQTVPCGRQTCSVCCIIKTSFDLRYFGTKNKWGRFGKGIYTSATSSKSDGYSNLDRSRSEFKAMLLNRVVVGNGFKMTENDSNRTAPPAGYNSVIGEVGGALNYDELVVYRNDAILPSFLVLYS